MDETQVDKEASPFLVLCEPKLEHLYASQIDRMAEDLSFAFRFVSDPVLFALGCMQNPPVAGLVDLGSLIRGNSEKMNRLFAFRTRWPVLRARIGSDGRAEVVRRNPPLIGPLQETLADLIAGGSAFENSCESRLNLRCAVQIRARLRLAEGLADWNRVHIQNISRGGCLVVASDPPAPGTQVEIEVCDLPGGSARLNAEVVWSRNWVDSVDIPQCGLRFQVATLPEVLFNALGDPDFSTRPY